MVKKIKKKEKILQDPLDEIVVETKFEDDSDQSSLHNHNMGFSSPQRDSPFKSTFEETGSLGGFVKAFNVDTTTNLGDFLNPSIPKQTSVYHPKSRLLNLLQRRLEL